ncbi:MAG: M14 family metallopeptidase, partial [Anaerolineales bacterium]|nr:M14 family metallopeptidase [Anaerolineales bacterium]MCX7756265.1 M14 family metallopeptidase [Anaerolineales bacterium]MDW8277376.1 M14 family metallopeptidase [Anaerolineales bacterium]
MTTLPDSYQTSRARFRARLETLRPLWPSARLTSIAHPWEDDLTTDVLTAAPRDRRDRLIVLSTGLHGIEGYLGSAALELFFEEYLRRLDPQTTGLLLIHAINPWGMKHWQRNNPQNVDLNRNFIEGDFAALRRFNPDYPALSPFLNPRRPLNHLLVEKLRFAAQTVHKLLTFGARRIREAALMGQYHQPEGIYFGGAALQPETRAMMELYRSCFAGYAEIIHLDMHTGYGPRFQMTLVTSPHEKRTAAEIRARWGLPRVAAANPDEFYTMQGDMTDWEYQLVEREFPSAKFFGAACEFGTFGEGILAGARSLRVTIFKNQVNQHGASSAAAGWVNAEYRELYLPSEPAWLAKAMSDARQTFEAFFV